MAAANEPTLRLRDCLEVLKKKGKRDRDKLAREIGTSPQRINGYVDLMEELELITLDRSIRPYQIEITALGKKIHSQLGQTKLGDLLQSGVGSG